MTSNQNNSDHKKGSLQTYHDVVHSKMRYEWDLLKAETNLQKHGISFAEAKEALVCKFVCVLKTTTQNNEERFVYLGLSSRLNILVVVVAYPDAHVTRIISARKANKRERNFYETQL